MLSQSASVNAHAVEEVFKCQKCNRQYGGKTELKSHLLWHTGKADFACQTCQKAFKNRIKLKEHFRLYITCASPCCTPNMLTETQHHGNKEKLPRLKSQDNPDLYFSTVQSISYTETCRKKIPVYSLPENQLQVLKIEPSETFGVTQEEQISLPRIPLEVAKEHMKMEPEDCSEEVHAIPFPVLVEYVKSETMDFPPSSFQYEDNQEMILGGPLQTEIGTENLFTNITKCEDTATDSVYREIKILRRKIRVKTIPDLQFEDVTQLDGMSLSEDPEFEAPGQQHDERTGSAMDETNISDVPPIVKRKHICWTCNAELPSHEALRQHRMTHQAVFDCKFCDKNFLSLTGMKLHLKSHTGKGWIHCNMCDKQFKQWAKLEAHLVSHTGKTKYYCEQCQKGFVHKRTLLDHVRRHQAVTMLRTRTRLGREGNASR